MEEENADRLQLQHLAGGNIIKFPPLFSPDASQIFVVVDKVVQVFSSSTGQSIRFLEGATHPLISLEYDLLDKQILISCTEAGKVIRWKWSTGRLVSQVQLGNSGQSRFETFNVINHYADGDSLCALITIVNKPLPRQCFVVNTVTGDFLKRPLNLKLGRAQAIIDVDKEHFNYIALCQGPFVFFIDYRTWEWRKLTNLYKERITCVKVHPKEKMTATGDETGKITLWRQFFGHNNDIRTVLFHWHHTRVTSIAFSYSGSSFFSSGLEAVLVRWNINRPDRKEFVPRMSSIVVHVTTSQENSSVAVSTGDNGIQILDVDFKTKCTLQEFTYTFDDKTENEIFPVGLRMNPRKNTLVLNGRVGHLQFYSAYTKSMLYNMDIVGQNVLSIESEKILYNIRVTHAAFNIDWMVTGEIFNDNQRLPELRLKFWQYQKEIQSYALNTNVELPHEGGLKAVEFSNPYYVENLICATAGLDNVIKIWSLEDSNNIYKKGKVWYCVGRTSYKNFPIESIGFSQDGSLLAAGFGNSLCVYKAESLKLLAALIPHGTFDGSLHKVQLSISKIKRNGSKNDLNAKKQKVLQLFTSLLNANEETLLKEIKNSVKSKKLKEYLDADESQKKLLFKKIQSMTQLNLFQKLLVYQKLGIYFQLPPEWLFKMRDYIQANKADAHKTKELAKKMRCLNIKSRFKAKYRISKYADRKMHYENKISSRLVPLLDMMQDNDTPKLALTNGLTSHSEEESLGTKNVLPPLQSVVSVRKVAFCFGDFAHLVIACTENRVLIWNLLTLRLQTVLKLSTEHIAVDSQTNLISVFTKNRELYVFLPSSSLPLYYRPDMPRVHGAVWLPRKHPKPQAVIVNWQARSTLYFLTENNEIMYLGAYEDYEQPTVAFAEDADDSLQQYSTFGTFAANQFNNVKSSRQQDRGLSIGVHGKAAVKSFLEMSTHTMAPLSLLCTDFLKSVVQLNSTNIEKSSRTSDDHELNGTNDLISNEDDDPHHEGINENQTKTSIRPDNELNEDYLQKVASEIIEFEF